MPKPAPDHRANITLTMRAELAEKAERVAVATNSSKNAVFTALIALMSEAELTTVFNQAVKAGLVAPRNKAPGVEEQELARKLAANPELLAKAQALLAAGR